jgi:uncharacterized protein
VTETDREAIRDRAEAFVRGRMQGDGSGHDWWHVHRVRRTALHLALVEGADPYVVELAALLHDVWDHKLHHGDAGVAPREVRRWLEEAGADKPTVGHVCEIVAGVSFRGAGVPTPMRTLEGAVVQDADRLDAIGAVGIGRAFAFGGSRGRPLHDPETMPEPHATFEAYSGSAGGTIHHFHEKLLLLRDRMNTRAARRVAEGRHAFMEAYLRRFHAEWEGMDDPDLGPL